MEMGTWDIDAEDLAKAGYMLEELTTDVDSILERNEEDLASSADRRHVAGEIVNHLCRKLGDVDPPVVEDDDG